MATETDSSTTHSNRNISDRNFDSLAERFRDRIYGTTKGELRLTILWEDMQRNLPQIDGSQALQVWDAGCGLGQVGLRLAQQGHSVLMSDLSGQMLSLSRERAEADQVSEERLEWQQGAIQELAEQDRCFDLIVCHAVMEWLAEPRDTLIKLLSCLKSGGALSLLFYNVNSVITNNLIKGNFRKVVSGDYRGHPGSLTPLNPLNPDAVYAWLQEAGLTIQSRCGVRVVHDLLRRELRSERSFEDLLELERAFCRKEPFLSLARYIHVVATKPLK